MNINLRNLVSRIKREGRLTGKSRGRYARIGITHDTEWNHKLNSTITKCLIHNRCCKGD